MLQRGVGAKKKLLKCFEQLKVICCFRPRLHDTAFISYRIEVLFTCENGVKCIGLVRSLVNRKPIRFEMKTVSCKYKANPI